MQSGKAVTSTRKAPLVADQQLLATGYVKTAFAHKATAGQSTINLTALTTPPEMTLSGFSNPTSAQLQAASLLFYPANLTLTSSLRGLLIRKLSYDIAGSTTITLLGFTAQEGEIFVGTIDYTAVNGNLVVPATSQPATGQMAAGVSLFNIGTPYPTNKYPTTSVGAVLVFDNGVLQARNTGNSSSTLDGNYYEVDNGGGQFSTVQFNTTDPDNIRNILVIPNGLQVAQPNGSIQAVVESLAGQLTSMAAYVAALAGTTPQTITGAAPTNVDLTTFGNTVITLNQNAALKNAANTFTANQTFGTDVTTQGGLNRQGDDAIFAYQNGSDQAVSITQGSVNTVNVTFNTTAVDITTAFTSNTYTCKKAGTYRITFNGQLVKSSGTAVANNQVQCAILKNGSATMARPTSVEAGPASAAGTIHAFSSTILQTLAVGDTIAAQLQQNFGAGFTWVGTLQSASLTIDRI